MISTSKKINSIEFKKFIKKGVKRKSRYFNIILVEDKKNNESKFAVILSKKKIKTAVLRHKNKRIIFNIISQIYPQFLRGKYIFIFINEDISRIETKKLKDYLLKILTF